MGLDSRGLIKFAPSILSSDHAKLGEAVAEATEAGADMIHVDIMDGHFVPMITWGAATVAALKSWTTLPLDVHLMIEQPEKHVKEFLDAGADIITVHVEACTHLHRIIDEIKRFGSKVGVAINPGTSMLEIEGVLHWLDQVLVMTVNPGLPGQQFIPGIEKKIARIFGIMEKREAVNGDLEVDGGINIDTAPLAVQAGANILVAGSSVFNEHNSVSENVSKIMKSIR